MITRRLTVVAIALLLAAASPLGAAVSSVDERGADRVWEILGSWVPGDRVSGDSALSRLDAMGRAGVPAIADVLSGRLPSALEAAARAGREDVQLRPITREERGLLIRSLSRRSAADLRPLLEDEATPGDDRSDRLLGLLQILRDVTTDGTLPLVLDVIRGFRPFELRSPLVAPAARVAISTRLWRERGAFGALEEDWPDLGEEARRLILEAVGQLGTPESFAFLGTQLLDRASAPGALELMSRHVGLLGPFLDESLWRALRSCLRSSDASVARAAAKVVGLGHDVAAVPILIDLVRRAEPRTVGVAVWALERISGRRHDRDVARWQRWLEAERVWYRDSWEPTLSLIEGEDPAKHLDAIAATRGRRLYRNEIGAGLSVLLRSDAPAVVVATCGALGELGCPLVLGDLVDALERPESEVRIAARRALRMITGHRDAMSPAAWRETLGLTRR